ncbi:MAG: hypothetical protein J7L08_04505 [Candidatus Aenigmarchaeota archaeon]|nr:hypothetical protein [Candidatus Aenigmarchaeota archaeon]
MLGSTFVFTKTGSVETIPINEMELLECSSATIYVADTDCFLYQVKLVAEGQNGILMPNGKRLKKVLQGAYSLRRGESVNIKGDWIVIK